MSLFTGDDRGVDTGADREPAPYSGPPPTPLTKPITGPRNTDLPSTPGGDDGFQKQEPYPVFGDTTGMPDPSKYSSAINGAFDNFSKTLGNMWGQLKGPEGGTAPQAQGSETRPVNYGFTETADPVTSDAGGGDSRTTWYGSPWLSLGSKNGMNQFQRTMGGLAASRQKKSGLF